MPISMEQVERVAGLARLKLTPTEKESLKTELSQIITYFDLLSEVNTENISLIEENVSPRQLRDDIPTKSLDVEDALKNASRTKDNCIIVPRIL
ncbi:MAG: Asp-tRNA(Asn)/Glu-tRNA(Gln) amidotransferase subunit GatC [candidate division Zixibacteria bacterium]|nr:Asp-tRNA(Asn)/Glu-tRNA(Gln) amidotransferase subunit GatC [candidate division Zixibacteria bacterium]